MGGAGKLADEGRASHGSGCGVVSITRRSAPPRPHRRTRPTAGIMPTRRAIPNADDAIPCRRTFRERGTGPGGHVDPVCWISPLSTMQAGRKSASRARRSSGSRGARRRGQSSRAGAATGMRSRSAHPALRCAGPRRPVRRNRGARSAAAIARRRDSRRLPHVGDARMVRRSTLSSVPEVHRARAMPRHDKLPTWITRRRYAKRAWVRRLWGSKRTRPDVEPPVLPPNVVPFPGVGTSSPAGPRSAHRPIALR